MDARDKKVTRGSLAYQLVLSAPNIREGKYHEGEGSAPAETFLDRVNYGGWGV